MDSDLVAQGASGFHLFLGEADAKIMLSEAQPDKIGGHANSVGKQLVRRKEASGLSSFSSS